jgi:hypothetical protein
LSFRPTSRRRRNAKNPALSDGVLIAGRQPLGSLPPVSLPLYPSSEFGVGLPKSSLSGFQGLSAGYLRSLSAGEDFSVLVASMSDVDSGGWVHVSI